MIEDNFLFEIITFFNVVLTKKPLGFGLMENNEKALIIKTHAQKHPRTRT